MRHCVFSGLAHWRSRGVGQPGDECARPKARHSYPAHCSDRRSGALAHWRKLDDSKKYDAPVIRCPCGMSAPMHESVSSPAGA